MIYNDYRFTVPEEKMVRVITNTDAKNEADDQFAIVQTLLSPRCDHMAGLEGAHSSELAERTPYPVIDLMPDQVGITAKGGTMRLGSYPCHLKEGSLAASIYGELEIHERHRHRYEFNNDYREELSAAGLSLSGLSPDGHLVEVIELPGHPWFVAGQFHPELKSRPNRAHPLFRGLIGAAKAYKNEQ